MRYHGRFFRYARERYQIFLKREAGEARPWTRDKILQTGRFCNVYREDDRTTRWFRECVREPLRDRPEVLLATVVFRMLNRITTGEAVFRSTAACVKGRRSLIGGSEYLSPFDLFVQSGNTAHLRRAILQHCGKGPYVTGAYIISSPAGYTKLDGVMEILRRFYQDTRYCEELGDGGYDDMGWRDMAGLMLDHDLRGVWQLRVVWQWLKQFDYLGKFHSYEIVTDLRHTGMLDHAQDIMTWANPGPGARRGMNRVLGRDYDDKRITRDELIDRMLQLLELSQDQLNWPYGNGPWEMREVEHTLCEFDKYERVRLDQGRMKGKFK